MIVEVGESEDGKEFSHLSGEDGVWDEGHLSWVTRKREEVEAAVGG